MCVCMWGDTKWEIRAHIWKTEKKIMRCMFTIVSLLSLGSGHARYMIFPSPSGYVFA